MPTMRLGPGSANGTAGGEAGFQLLRVFFVPEVPVHAALLASACPAEIRL